MWKKEEVWPSEKGKLSVEVGLLWMAAVIKVTQQAKIELAAHRYNFVGEQLKAAAAGLATVIVCLLSPIIAQCLNLSITFVSLFKLSRCNS